MFKVFITCLAAYNNGTLHGEWYEVTSEPDDTREAIKAVLASSPVPDAEEWFVTDYEGDWPESLSGSEHPDLNKLSAWVEFAESGLPVPLGVASEFFSDRGNDDWDAYTIQDAYAGQADSLEDWAREFMEETGGLEGVPENLRNYFDYKALVRDMLYGGEITNIREGGTVYVFWNH